MAKENISIKRNRFKTVASKRVQKVLDSIDALSKCSNKNNYEYSNEDINRMLKAIKEKVKILELSYTTSTKLNKETFQF